MTTISEQIKQALQEEYKSGAKQQEMAARHHVSQQYICRLLSGRRATGGLTVAVLEKMFPGATINLHGGAAASGDPDDPLLTELLTHWPRLTRGEQAKVVALAIDLLEKKGSAVQPEILDRAK